MEDTNSVSFDQQQEGQPATTSAPQVQEPVVSNNGEVNQSDVLKDAVANAIKEILPTVVQSSVQQELRNFQSMADKMQARIKKETQAAIDTLKNAGVEITPKVQEAIATQTKQKITSELSDSNSQPQPAQVDGRDTASVDASNVNQIAEDYLKKNNLPTIATNDPEAGIIITNGTPEEYLRTYQAAAKAKSLRLSQGQTATKAPPPSQPITTSGGARGNPISTINDMDSLYEMAIKRR